MGGYGLRSAFDSRTGQMIMVALVLMVGSFYAGTLFGNNAPIYVSQASSSSSSSPSSNPSSSSSTQGVFTFIFENYTSYNFQVHAWSASRLLIM